MNSDENGRYHLPKEASQPVVDRIRQASVAELEKWSRDPACIEREVCAKEIDERLQRQLSRAKTVEVQQTPQCGQASVFDPRKEISADAAYIAGRIIKHLWLIFVLLPVILAVLYELLK